MTSFQRITFHNFRLQRNMIPRNSVILPILPTKLTLKKVSLLLFLQPLPLLSVLVPLSSQCHHQWHPLCRLCAACQLAWPAQGVHEGRNKTPCRGWAQTPSECYPEILIWILGPDTHSFIKGKYSRQLMLHFFYYSNLLLTMKKMMSSPGCDKGLILYAVKTMSQQFLCPWGQSIQQFCK